MFWRAGNWNTFNSELTSVRIYILKLLQLERNISPVSPLIPANPDFSPSIEISTRPSQQYDLFRPSYPDGDSFGSAGGFFLIKELFLFNVTYVLLSLEKCNKEKCNPVGWFLESMTSIARCNPPSPTNHQATTHLVGHPDSAVTQQLHEDIVYSLMNFYWFLRSGFRSRFSRKTQTLLSSAALSNSGSRGDPRPGLCSSLQPRILKPPADHFCCNRTTKTFAHIQ